MSTVALVEPRSELGLEDLHLRMDWDDAVSNVDTRKKRGTWRLEDSSDGGDSVRLF